MAKDRWSQQGVVSYASACVCFPCLLFCIWLSKLSAVFTGIGYNSCVFMRPVSGVKKKIQALRKSRVSEFGNRFFLSKFYKKDRISYEITLTHKESVLFKYQHRDWN